MKKIFVISSYAYIRNHNNYGSVFQYYAIQKYFEELGYSTYWLKFILPKTNFLFFLLHLVKYQRKPNLVLENLICHFSFMKFIKYNLNTSSKFYHTESDLEKNCPSGDYYITGSDQVWGGILRPNFLAFVPDNNKKIALCVSFGREKLSDEQKKQNVDRMIKQFNNISVREKSGINICERLGKKAIHLLDPTFLLDKMEYISSGKSSKKTFNKDFLYCYFLNLVNRKDVHIYEIIRFAQVKGYELKITADGDSGMVIPINYLVYPSPADWLYAYSQSKYVITNTFHGTVFAIIFRKQFVTIVQNGKTAEQNNRIIELLQELNLGDRIWNGSNNLSALLEKEIDWTTANKRIADNKFRTNEFLKKTGL